MLKCVKAGFVITLACLIGCAGEEETTPPSGPLLEPPPEGQGFQLSTFDFPVEAGTEVQDCYFFRVSELAEGAGIPVDEMFLHRVQISYRPGSHHMNIFRVRTILDLDPANGDIQRSLNGQSACSKSVNWADWPLIANAQNGDIGFDWTYPDGVVNTLEPDEIIMLQTHYVNATTQTTPGGGRVDVNFWVSEPDEVENQLGTVFTTRQSIRICQSNPTPQFGTGCGFNSTQPLNIIGANGHFHSRGKEFGMYVWDGVETTTPDESERFYTSTNWQEPPMATSPELTQQVPPGGGIWYTCSFQWVPPPENIGCEGLNKLDKELFDTPDEALDCCYTFGNTVDRAEHCNVFAYYYPKQDNLVCY